VTDDIPPGHAILAVDLRPGSSRYDEQAGRRRAFLDLYLVRAGPGFEDSRYHEERLRQLPATAWDDAIATLEGMGDALSVPTCRCQPGDRYYRAGRWIDTQPEPPDIDWAFRWTATAHCGQGLRSEHTGEVTTQASSGSRALHGALREVSRDLSARADIAAFRVSTTLTLAEGQREHAVDEWPEPAMSRGRARVLLASGEPASSWLRALGPLDAMVCIARVLEEPLEDVETVGAWRRGTCADAAFDDWLAHRAHQRSHAWRPQVTLLDAYTSGRGVRGALRTLLASDLGKIRVIKALWDVFGLSLAEAQSTVHRCNTDTVDDRAFEEELQRGIRTRPGW
jgi:hypothetical protein